MSTEVLSQDEVDALLKGVNGDEEPEVAAAAGDGPRPYNLATQERIVRGRMPTLEIINERFSRLLRDGMFNFMRKSPDISIGPIKTQKYGEFVRNLTAPTNLNIVALKPLRGNALVVFDPALVFAVIDNLFGGDSRFQASTEGRDFSSTEMRIAMRLLEVVLDNYSRAWQPVHPLRFEHVRSEMHSQFANIATPSEVVVTTTFAVEFGTAGGEIYICIPYATVEPIRDLLYSSSQADSAEPDTRWMKLLTREVQNAEVEVTAQLARAPVKLAQVLGMRQGDIINLDIKPTLTAEVDGVPIFDCRYGVINGRYALKVERTIQLSPTETNPGEAHV